MQSCPAAVVSMSSDDQGAGRVLGNLRIQERLLGRHMTGMALRQSGTIGGIESLDVVRIESGPNRRDACGLESVCEWFQIEILSRCKLSDGTDAQRPLHAGAGFMQIESGQGPVRILPGEPEIGEVVFDVDHCV